MRDTFSGRGIFFSGGGIFFSGGGIFFSGGGKLLLGVKIPRRPPPLYESLECLARFAHSPTMYILK